MIGFSEYAIEDPYPRWYLAVGGVLSLVFLGVAILALNEESCRDSASSVVALVSGAIVCATGAVFCWWRFWTYDRFLDSYKSRHEVTLAATGIRVGEKTRWIPWSEIDGFRENIGGQRLDLVDRQGRRLASVSYDLYKFRSCFAEIRKYLDGRRRRSPVPGASAATARSAVVPSGRRADGTVLEGDPKAGTREGAEGWRDGAPEPTPLVFGQVERVLRMVFWVSVVLLVGGLPGATMVMSGKWLGWVWFVGVGIVMWRFLSTEDIEQVDLADDELVLRSWVETTRIPRQELVGLDLLLLPIRAPESEAEMMSWLVPVLSLRDGTRLALELPHIDTQALYRALESWLSEGAVEPRPADGSTEPHEDLSRPRAWKSETRGRSSSARNRVAEKDMPSF